MAAMRGRREFSALLIQRGADPTITDDSGRIAADMTDDAELAAGLRDPAAAGAAAAAEGEGGSCAIA